MIEARTNEMWILGATGRVGRDLTRALARTGAPLVLVGRSSERLQHLAADAGGKSRVLVLDGIEAITRAIRHGRPKVVVNLLGGYAESAPSIARASMPGGSYVDLSSDLVAIQSLIDLDDEARRGGSTLIAGAGFGVIGTEAVVAHLCEGRPVPRTVHIDALPSFASEEGKVGEAFARTAVDVITAGGRRYVDGALVAIPLGSNLRRHELPDGTTALSAAVSSGELLAARRVSGARNVDFTSGLAPTGRFVRALLPLAVTLLRVSVMRRVMVRAMAASRTKAAPRPRPHSWGHAVITWDDGTSREAWLRVDDAMEYTVSTLTMITSALASGAARAGASTPTAAFGARIATDAGGMFVDAH